MDDWITVRQASHILDVSTQRVYALIAAGTLSHKKLGLVTVVNKRSVMIYKDSPDRNKFAAKNQSSLFDPEQSTLPLDGEEEPSNGGGFWSGLKPPVLSVEARRLYDASPRGERERRQLSQSGRGEV